MTQVDNTSLPAPSPKIKELIEALKNLYERNRRGDEFAEEEAVYQILLPSLMQDLEPSHLLKSPLGLGSTATVWIVLDQQLRQQRALKLPRPRLGLLKNILEIVRDERVRLAALNHQNIIKIFSAGEVRLSHKDEEYSFPYFVMEFLEQVQDLDQFITDNYRRLKGQEIIGYFRDVLSGLRFLHSQSIIHCDLKPGNILIAPGRPALIADLGYAKHIPKQRPDNKETSVKFTQAYGHPELRAKVVESSDPAANVSRLVRSDLREGFDLFATGRTMQEVLVALRDKERTDPKMHFGQKSTFTRYQWLFLSFLAKRLLDGVIEKHRQDDDLASDVIPGLTERTMQEIKYLQAEDAIEDIEKLLHLYDLEGEVPELNPNLPTYIQVPHARVPLTSRVHQIISHPSFSRLARVTQLGFISLVYPGATHTRLEHVLGTFSRCCDYIRALWYDQANCIFSMVMSSRDIGLGLAAALVHDIAQYPMAHDFTEADSRFAHERLTRQILERQSSLSSESLADILESEWSVSVDEIISVLNAGGDSSFRHRILKSIINGPIDCDKLDYLRRDSTHLGVNFGYAIDEDRLLRNLTVIYKSEPEETIEADGRSKFTLRLAVAEIGVTEKALVVAKTIHRVRQDMFKQVYWQHTVRAMKAMLGYAIRKTLLRQDTDQRRAAFWSAFQALVIEGQLEHFEPTDTMTPFNLDLSLAALGIQEEEKREHSPLISSLSGGDNLILEFLYRFSGDPERRIISALRARNLFRRLAVISGARKESEYEGVYNNFRTYRLEGDIKKIEEQRLTWQREIVRSATSHIKGNPSILGGTITVDKAVENLEQEDPLILVDIPMKALSRQARSEALGYLPEDFGGIHDRQRGALPRFSTSELDFEESNFDKEVGKIRIFAHPNWCAILTRCLKEDEVMRIISRY